MSGIALDDLNTMRSEDFVAQLANIFEHSPWVAEIAAAARPFAGVQQLHHAMTAAVMQSTPAQRLALITAHPDLADKTRRADQLTADSSAEQSGAGLDRLSDAEFDAFARANADYRARFGFPYIVCVRRRTKQAILDDFTARLANDADAETTRAIDEICKIAALRLDHTVSGPHPLAVNGRLSTHILDTHGGTPAAGIPIELRELSRLGPPRLIARATTNADGRTDAPLIAGRPVPIGNYELVFCVGDYFARRGATLSEPPFLDEIPIRFAVAEPEGHLHVPLLVTPWSFATYRGS